LTTSVVAVVAGATGVIWQWQRAEQNAADSQHNARNFQHERDKALEARYRAERHLKSARESIDELAKLGDQLWLRPETNANGKTLLEKVLVFYQELLKDESKDPEIRLGTAQVCGQVAYIRHVLGQMDKALQAWQQRNNLLEGLLTEEPGNTHYRWLLSTSQRHRAHVLRDMGKTLEARDSYREAIKLGEQVLAATPSDPTYQVSLANTLVNIVTVMSLKDHAPEMASMYERAMELTKLAIKTSPQEPGYQGELALCQEGQGMFHWHSGRAAQAEEAVRAALDVRKQLYERHALDRLSDRYLGRAYSSLGLIVAGRGRTDEADKLYSKALEILRGLLHDYPGDVSCRQELLDTHWRLASLHEKAGKYQNVVVQYRQIVELDPKSASANNTLAWFLVACPDLKMRDGHEAVRLAKVAVAAQPQDGMIWNTLGVAYYRDGDHKAAVEVLNQALQLRSGGDSYDWFFLAMAHWKLGNRDDARHWMAKGVEWLQLHATENEELRRFEAEAQALLSDSKNPTPSLETSPSGN
jgi:tetratricopeptide (TPR) repeat protein